MKLNDNDTSYTGTLCCLDGTMNILLTNASGARVEVTTYQREQCALYKEKLLIENGRDRSDCCKIYQFDFCVGVRWPRVNGWPVQRRECFKYP